jgi:hypothetical protein
MTIDQQITVPPFMRYLLAHSQQADGVRYLNQIIQDMTQCWARSAAMRSLPQWLELMQAEKDRLQAKIEAAEALTDVEQEYASALGLSKKTRSVALHARAGSALQKIAELFDLEAGQVAASMLLMECLNPLYRRDWQEAIYPGKLAGKAARNAVMQDLLQEVRDGEPELVCRVADWDKTQDIEGCVVRLHEGELWYLRPRK